jgi:hypothetical protein
MTSEQRWELYPPLDKANLPHNLDRNQWKWSSESSKRVRSTVVSLSSKKAALHFSFPPKTAVAQLPLLVIVHRDHEAGTHHRQKND